MGVWTHWVIIVKPFSRHMEEMGEITPLGLFMIAFMIPLKRYVKNCYVPFLLKISFFPMLSSHNCYNVFYSFYQYHSEQHLETGDRVDYPTTVIDKSSIFIFEGMKDPIFYLLLFSVIPGTICVFSCIYLIVCSR